MPDYGDDRLTDAQLAVRFQLANLLVGDEHWGKRLTELDKVVCARFGVTDTEGLAVYVTGSHMTAEEAVEWAASNFEDWKAWLTGAMTWERHTQLREAEQRGRDAECEAVLAYLERLDQHPVIRDLHRVLARGEHRAGRRG